MIKIIKDIPQKREEIFSVTMKTPDVSEIVKGIIEQVKTDGDKALKALTEKFDKAKLTSLRVTEAEIEEAVGQVSDEFLEILQKAAKNIREFHQLQRREGFQLKRENGAIYIGNAKSESKSLAKLCQSSDECLLLCATLGIGVDRLVLKTASISARDAFVIDAMADALIESLCDYAEARICEGLLTTGRFSPGYGDLELSLGGEIIALTDAERAIGIKLTASGLMIPKKSVNAIIAIRKNENE